METLMEQLVDSIKNESCYKKFIFLEEQLKEPSVQLLLKEYQFLLNEYNENKKYHKYANFDDSKLALHSIKNKVSENVIIKEYYQVYHELQCLLEDITNIIFDDISPTLVKGGFQL